MELMFVLFLMFLLFIVFARVAWGGPRQVPPPDKVAPTSGGTMYTDQATPSTDDGSITHGHIVSERQRADDRTARQVEQLRTTARGWGDDLVAQSARISANQEIEQAQARLDRAQWLGIRNPDQDIPAARAANTPLAKTSFVRNEYDVELDDDRQPPAQPRYVDGFEVPPRTSPPNW